MIGKYRLGERVRVDMDVKVDYPAVGIITNATIRLGKYFYNVKFDRGLVEKPLYSQIYSLAVYEDRLHPEAEE